MLQKYLLKKVKKIGKTNINVFGNIRIKFIPNTDVIEEVTFYEVIFEEYIDSLDIWSQRMFITKIDPEAEVLNIINKLTDLRKEMI